MFKICVYVPEKYTEAVKSALFKAGAGEVGNYSCCAWQVLGEGQFMPLKGSEAFIGEQDQLEKVAEYRVEMVCDENSIEEAVAALIKAHPYETPAYQVIRCENF